MTLFDKLRSVKMALDSLQEVRNSLVAEAIGNGCGWKELAYVDKMSAVKLYRDVEKCELKHALNMVSVFLNH